MSEIYIFYLVSSGTHTSLGTCTNYSIIYMSKTFYTAGIEGSKTLRNTARRTQKQNKDSNEQLTVLLPSYNS